ncbi:MAG: SDR family oxidoreductase [Actinomycetes bacterium]
MSELYEGKLVLVTGSSRGLGKAIAHHFLGHGATVIGLSRSAGAIEHPAYSHLTCDVGDPQDVQAAFAEIRKHGSLDILVNNSGVAESQHSVLLSARSATEMLATNLLGPFLVSREAAKLMKKSGGGRIVNIGSMMTVLEPFGGSVYAASKAGFVTLTNVQAKEFASFNITCNTIGVTAIESDMLRKQPRKMFDEIIAGLPIPRYADPDDVFNVIDFLSSERSSYITAQTIYLGGIHE